VTALGQFTKPDLPDARVQWVGTTQTVIPPSQNQIVAIPIVHDWGPSLSDTPDTANGIPGGLQVYQSLQDWEAVYGTGNTAGRDAVVGAFLGMNIPGGAGAGGIITPRMITGSGAVATLSRNNTTPAAAITFTARYKGTAGNNISVVVEADPNVAANDRVRLLFNGVTKEQYSYLRTDIASLVAAINGRPSRLVTATQIITGVALATTTGVPLASGNDGSSVTTTEYAAVQTALENKEFGVLAPFNLTDIPTKVQIANWMKTMEDAQKPFRLIFGGAAAEVLSAIQSELSGNAILRDPQIIRFGFGTIHDDVLNKDMSTAQLASRIAGGLVARGERASLTSCEFGGLHYVGSTGPLRSDIVAGAQSGITMLQKVTDPDTDLAIAQGVSTFISTTTPGRPYKLFSEPRIVGILNNIQREITSWARKVIVGDVTVTDDTRMLVAKQVRVILDRYEGNGLAQRGSGFVTVFNTDNDPTLDDTIPYQFGFKPARTANFVLGEGRLS
jgi:hypothetical protein